MPQLSPPTPMAVAVVRRIESVCYAVSRPLPCADSRLVTRDRRSGTCPPYPSLDSTPNSPRMKKILIVVPVFNEAASIEENLRQILAAATHARGDIAFHLLVIDDGSVDGTAEALTRYCQNETRAAVLRFTRNFGKESAITAGLHATPADTDAVILIDSDLQHPPGLIPKMIALWESGFNVVEAIKQHRGKESAYSRLLASGFYKLFALLARLNIRGQSDFKLLDRAVVDQLNQLPEQQRFFRGLVQWMGHATARIPFSVADRANGSSRWNLLMLVKYALHNISSFSAIPLQLVTWAGLVSLLVGCVFGGIALIQKLQGQAIDGFTTVILLMVFFSGTLMLSLGIIGHYLSRIYDEIKRRPSYILQSPTETRTRQTVPLGPMAPQGEDSVACRTLSSENESSPR